MTQTEDNPPDEWGGNPPQEIARQPPKPWRTQVTWTDIDTGEIIITANPYKQWTPIKQEVHVYENKRWRIREIVHLCERTRQTSLDFRD